MKAKNNKGISLIEVLISIFILVILSLSIFSLFQYALKVLAENKARVGAVALANEKLELIRNLAYSDVGTYRCLPAFPNCDPNEDNEIVVGVPRGMILQQEIVTKNGVNYTADIEISYHDDPFDGEAGIDDDNPNDYKIATVDVSWTAHLGLRNVIMKTNIAPRGLEAPEEGGTLKITVFNASGQPVVGADIWLANNNVVPAIGAPYTTDDTGVKLIPGVPESADSYEITVSNGLTYSSDKTCMIDNTAPNADCTDTEGIPDPLKPHATVLEGEVTEISFAIDELSTLIVNSINQTIPEEWVVNEASDGEDQDNPAIAVCSSGEFVFAWRDDDVGNQKLYSQRYNSNREKQWPGGDKPIATASHQNNIDLAVDDSCNVYAVWQDDRDSHGNEDIYIASYDTSGNDLWSGDQKIATQSESADQSWPKIILNSTSTSAYVVWQDNRDVGDEGDIYIKRFFLSSSPPSITTAWNPEIKVNSDPGDFTQAKPVIAIDAGNNTYIAWEDAQYGDYDIMAQKISSDGNHLWTETQINTDTSGFDQINAEIIIDSTNNIYVVWQDYRNGEDYDIYIQKYNTNGGVPTSGEWTSGDIKVNSDVGEVSQENPSIAISSNDEIFIVWQDYRNGNADIYMQILNTSGQKQLPNDVRIGDGTTDQENPSIVIPPPPNNQYPTITWQDNSTGDWDIKAAQYAGDVTNISIIGNLPFTLTGAKTYDVSANIYKYQQSNQTDSLGAITISDMEWDLYDFLVSGGYTLLSSEPPFPFLLNPNTTQTVILNVE